MRQYIFSFATLNLEYHIGRCMFCDPSLPNLRSLQVIPKVGTQLQYVENIFSKAAYNVSVSLRLTIILYTKANLSYITRTTRL